MFFVCILFNSGNKNKKRMNYKQRLLDIFVFLPQIIQNFMKKVLFFIFCFLSLSSLGQNVDKLSDDPRILVGEIPNGLKYYIVNNKAASGISDFYLVQKIGTLVENDGEEGMISFIGNMGLRGTRNFPNNEILDYFRKLGLSSNKDYGVEVGKEESVFRISNVPIKQNYAALDSMLLILYNMGNAINLDEQEVEREKVFQKNYILKSVNYDSRVEEKLANQHFKGIDSSSYFMQKCLSNIDGFSGKDIRTFYYKWFRPDLQAVVIVSDLDSKQVESKIKSLFQAAPKSLTKDKGKITTIAKKEDVDIAIVKDRDGYLADMRLSFRFHSLPSELKLSAIPFVSEYMNAMTSYILEDRLLIASNKSINSQIVDIDYSFGNYYGLKNEEAIKFRISTIPSNADTVFFNTIKEIRRLSKTGVTNDEFVRARERYYKTLRHKYYIRNYADNSNYAHRCIDNFLKGYSLASVELKTEYLETVKLEVTLKQFDTYVRAVMSDDSMFSIGMVFPDNENFIVPSKEKIRNIYMEAFFEPVTNFENVPVPMKLINNELVAGTIIDKIDEPISNSVQLVLSNGARVIIKNTKNNIGKIDFVAIAKGGLSLMKSPQFIDQKVLNLGRLGAESAFSISRLMKDKKIDLERKISLYADYLEGSFYQDDAQMFLELVNLYFTNYGADQKAFENYQHIVTEKDKFQKETPEAIFRDEFSKIQYSRQIPPADYDNSHYYRNIVDFMNKRLSNAADYVFVFVGDLDPSKIEPIILKYIGSLNGNSSKKSMWHTHPFYLTKHNVSKKIVAKMEIDKCQNIYSMKFPVKFDLYNLLKADLLTELIAKRIILKFYEAGIPLDCEKQYLKYPEEFLVFNLMSVTDSCSNIYDDVLKEEILSIRENGFTQEELDRVKAILINNYNYGRNNSNEFWINIIKSRYMYGKDLSTRYLDYINRISLEDINLIASDYLESLISVNFSMSRE